MLKVEVLEKALKTYEQISENPYYGNLNIDKEYQELLELASRVNSYKFKIAVLGEFTTGKSTILNALIGEELLPVGFLPTTKQLIKIEHSEKEYVRIEEDPEAELPLTRENVKKLVSSTSENIEIAKKLPEKIKSFVFYDTPGVNDVNELSEKIVFDLLSSVDIVLFVLDSTQALKKTELDFFSNIVQRKDIEKFFFILNKSDLVGDEIESVEKTVINTLSKTLAISNQLLEYRVIPYSAKRTIKAMKEGKIDELSYTGHKLLVEKICNFIQNNRVKLLEDRVKEEILQIIDKSLTKINTMIDKIKGKDKEYEKQLQEVRKQIEKFKLLTEREINIFKSNFSKEVDNFKSDIEKSFVKIRKEIEEKIDETDLERLSQQGYIDTILEDLIESELSRKTEKFIRNLSRLIKNFDDRTLEDLKEVYGNSDFSQAPGIEISNRLNGLFKAMGIVSVPIVAVNLIPSMLGGGILASLVGAAVVAGMIMNPKVAIDTGKAAGELAVKAGELTAQFMHWVSGQMSVAGEHIGKRVKKEEYKKKIAEYVEKVKTEILERIDEKITPDEFIDKYIQTMFPQKFELEKKMKTLEAERKVMSSVAKEDLRTLEEMKKRLEEVINGI
jgi:small GTP-binding protein